LYCTDSGGENIEVHGHWGEQGSAQTPAAAQTEFESG